VRPFLLSEQKIEIPNIGETTVFPGTMGEDL